MKRFVWEPAARSDLRRLDREAALRILHSLTRYGETGQGDVKHLTDRAGIYRLRVGNWRIFFDLDAHDQVRIHGVDSHFVSPVMRSCSRSHRPFAPRIKLEFSL